MTVNDILPGLAGSFIYNGIRRAIAPLLSEHNAALRHPHCKTRKG